MKKLISGTWTNDKYGIYERNALIFENTTSLAIYSDGSNLTNYSFEGQCSQASTPTPSSPVEVQEFGEKTENLFDKDNLTKAGSSPNFSVSGTTITMVGASSAGNYYYNAALLPAGNYSLTFNTSTSSAYYMVMGSNSDLGSAKINNTSLSANQATIATKLQMGYARFLRVAVTSLSVYSDVPFILCFAPIVDEWIISDVMLNSGSTALPYEPYGKYKIPVTSAGQTQNIILSEPLRKIGNYADSVDSMGVVTRKIKKLILDGTEDWRELGDSYVVNISSNYQFGVAALSTHYAWKATTPLANEQFTIVNAKVWIRDDSQSTLADFTTFLATQYANGTPVTVYYVLATPTISHGYNLFDKNKATQQAYIDASTGEIVATSSTTPYFATDYISIESNKEYWWTDSKRGNAGAFYDATKQYISGWNTSTSSSTTLQSFVAPNNAAYCRLSGSLPSIDTYMLNKGSTALPYEPYEYISLPSIIPTSSGFSNIEIGTSLAPSKVELDMGKMFVPKAEKVRVSGEWV